MAGLLPRMSGEAAWDSVASTGRKALEVARRDVAHRDPALSAEERRVLGAHEQELATSVTKARQFGFLLRHPEPILFVAGVILLALLTYLASRVAGHLSRQLSRPLQELVGWTERIRRGEPLGAAAEGRGAPEFAVLRDGMRQMAADLEAGRRGAVG